MQILNYKTIKKIEASKNMLERKLKVSISTSGKKLELEGEEYNKYIAERVFDAMDKNFSTETSLLLQSEDYVFESVPIKDFTHKKDLTSVRGRVLGKNGRTIEIIGELSECELTLFENSVNIIGPAEKIKFAVNAVKSIIQGAKTSKVYAYLEKARTKPIEEDLGLKIKLDKDHNK